MIPEIPLILVGTLGSSDAFSLAFCFSLFVFSTFNFLIFVLFPFLFYSRSCSYCFICCEQALLLPTFKTIYFLFKNLSSISTSHLKQRSLYNMRCIVFPHHTIKYNTTKLTAERQFVFCMMHPSLAPRKSTL